MIAELIAYGQIVSDDDVWNKDRKDDYVMPSKFHEAIKELKAGDELNIYVNSPGGDVMAATAMTSIIQRAKEKGVAVNAYIDGYAASAASFLVMAADNVYAYQSSMLMVHKPWEWFVGNADEMRKEAETLEKIEESTCIPLYMSKALVSEDEIKQYLKDETWMGAKQMSEVFNITVKSGTAPNASVTNAMTKQCIDRYKSFPQALKTEYLNSAKNSTKEGGNDLTAFFDAIELLKL